ncbi:MAG: SMP-30/gluconolactonase/LRE family protein, partial [Thermoanaerobaculia bacterium]
MAGFEKSQEGSSALYAFDLATGRLAGRYPLPSDGKPHAANDLALADDGDVYINDSLGSGIYRLRPGAPALEVHVEPGIFRSPQGAGFGPGGRLSVADYGIGLFWL